MNPEEFEYMWSDFEVNFIFASCYLSKIFREAEIFLIYDWTKHELKFFLSKKDRERIAEWALDIYQNHFDEWKNSIGKNIESGERLAKETENEKSNVAELSAAELRQHFLERATTFQSLLDDYFSTEFFSVSKAEKLVNDEPEKYSAVKKNLEEMGHIKLKARGVLNFFFNYRTIFKPYAEEIAKRFGRDDIEWLSFEKILDVADGKEVPHSELDRVYWVCARNLDWKVMSGNEAKKIMDDFDSHFFKLEGDFLKGVIASKGMYTGRVKVLRCVFSDAVSEEIKKVQRGDVLVAATTGPEVMTACEIAGAIVTDEGGLTSHAAIVSRELKIPCIVGTKVASKVLVDGDLIEVNADKGIVKILKRGRQ